VKVTVWLLTRERETWITGVEVLLLGIVLIVPSNVLVRLLFGIPLLVHVGYRALTSLPMGSVPGRPPRGQQRRRYDLRVRVVRFLEEVKRLEDYAQQAEVAQLPEREVREVMFTGQQRVMAAARQVARQTGQTVIRA